MLVDAIKVIAAEIDESQITVEHMEDRDQDLMRDCHRGFLRAHPRFQAMELVAQVRAFGLRGRDRSGDQRGFEEGITLTGAASLLLARAHMIGWTDPRPSGEALGRSEDRHVDADL